MVRYRNDEGRPTGNGRSFNFESRYCRVFLAPDNGATGGAGGATSTQTGATGGDGTNVTSQQQQQPASPWDTIKWDELDAGTAAVLRTAQADHQRVARENATLQQQAEADRQRVAQQQQQRQQQPAPNQQQTQVDPVEASIRQSLKEQGYNEAQINQQAPALAKVMGNLLPLFKASVGQDLAPLATTVISQQNTNNFEAAMQSPAGQQLFQDPELAQHVWTVVGQQTAAGRTFDPEAILNFAKMQYFDRQMAAGQPAPAPLLQPSSSSFFPTVAQPAPNRSTGFNFPGASLMRPLVTNNGGPGAAHAVNADTQAALATTFSEMARITGVAPKAFPSNLAHAGAGGTKK